MTSLTFGGSSLASLASPSMPWPRAAHLGRWPIGLLLVCLHLGLAVWLWHAGLSAHPILKPELHALTWVHLSPTTPEPPAPRPAAVRAATKPSHSEVTPHQPLSALASPKAIPTTAATAPQPASTDRADPTPTSEAPPAAVAAPGTVTTALRPISPSTPKELPSSALRYIVPPAQAYPLRSQRLGEQGTVWLRLIVNAEGRPVSVVVARSSGHARLDEQAVAAMQAARFAPHIDNGQALEWTALAPLTYELE